MSLKDHIPAPAESKWASEFAATHFLEMSIREFFSDSRFAPLMSRLDRDSWSELVKVYREITGEDIRNATAAVLLAQSLQRN